jgi:hypothetical protein
MYGGDSMSTYTTAIVGVLVLLVLYLLQDKFQIIYHASLWLEYLTSSVPTIDVPMTDAVMKDDGVKGEPCTKMELVDPSNPKLLNCYDPSTKQLLGQAKNMTPEEVNDILVKAKQAQVEWSKTTFAQRRMVLRTIQKYICQHVEEIVRVASRESGKPKVDAVLGEVITTCEKIRTICEWGELWLRPSYRPTGPMMMHKSAWVEYVPLGLIVAIAPWNYPFHNSVRERERNIRIRFLRRLSFFLTNYLHSVLLILLLFLILDQSCHFRSHGRKCRRRQGFRTCLMECRVLWQHYPKSFGGAWPQSRRGRDRHGNGRRRTSLVQQSLGR